MEDLSHTSGSLGPTLAAVSGARRYHRWLAEVLSSLVEDPVLEIGAGIGSLSISLAERGFEMLASEPDADLRRIMEQRVRDKPSIRLIEPIWLPVEEGLTFPVKAQTVLLSNVLEHILDDVEALASVKDVCPAVSRIAVVVPAHPWAFSPLDRALGHHRRYTMEGLHDALESAGWDVIVIRRFNSLGALTWFVSGRVLRRATISRWQVSLVELLVPLLRAADWLLRNRLIGQSLVAVASARPERGDC